MYYMDVLAKGQEAAIFFNPDVHRQVISEFLIAQKQSMKDVCLYCYNRRLKEKILCKSCDRWAHKNCIMKTSRKLTEICEFCSEN